MAIKVRRILTLCMVVVVCAALGGCGQEKQNAERTEEQRLYQKAVLDAQYAFENEIKPLVELVPENGQAAWNEDGQVLLLTYNDQEALYKAGETVTLPEAVWTVTTDEMASWYAENGAGVVDWTLRFEQLLGLPEDFGMTHFTAFWAEPADVIRPAFSTDITAQMSIDRLEEESTEYQEWFTANIKASFFDGTYPWTRMGYTYDWADNDTPYGLTEFLVADGAQVTVEYTMTQEAFLNMLAKKSAE